MDPPKKEKRAQTQKEIELNERRRAAQAELKQVQEKVKWTNVCKFTSRRNKGNTISAKNFLNSIRTNADAAAGVAAANAVASGKPASPAREEAKKEVKRNVDNAVRTVTRKLGPNAQNRRNKAKQNLLSVLSPHGKKPTAQSIQKLLGIRKRGEPNAVFLEQIQAAAAEAAAKTVQKVVKRSPKAKAAAPTEFKQIKEQVAKNVAESGMKVNAINRRALAIARQTRRNLSVANFMKGRPTRVRRVAKPKMNNTRNRNNVNSLRIRAPVFKNELSPVYEVNNESQNLNPNRF